MYNKKKTNLNLTSHLLKCRHSSDGSECKRARHKINMEFAIQWDFSTCWLIHMYAVQNIPGARVDL